MKVLIAHNTQSPHEYQNRFEQGMRTCLESNLLFQIDTFLLITSDDVALCKESINLLRRAYRREVFDYCFKGFIFGEFMTKDERREIGLTSENLLGSETDWKEPEKEPAQIAFEAYYQNSNASWKGLSDLGKQQWRWAADAVLKLKGKE